MMCLPRADCVTGDGDCVLYCGSYVCDEISFKLVDAAEYIQRLGDDRDEGICCEVDPNICLTDKHVYNHECMRCNLGTTNTPGDDKRDGDTTCDTTVCAAEEYVLWNTCFACAEGFGNELGDVAIENDTMCWEIPSAGMCEGNTNASLDMVCPGWEQHSTVSLETSSSGSWSESSSWEPGETSHNGSAVTIRPTHLHKPDPHAIDCASNCSIRNCCDSMPAEPPHVIHMWEAAPFPPCPAFCGADDAISFNRTVQCVEIERYSTGALVRNYNADVQDGNATWKCLGDVPATMLVCDHLGVNYRCDDGDSSTSKDTCKQGISLQADTEECTGLVHLAGSCARLK